MTDENRVRLRASCNACNASKVRCSQQRPTCARCKRNDTECIYGLSRRTHKDAPPISTLVSQRGQRLSRSGTAQSSGDMCPNSSTNSNTNSTSMSSTAARSNSCGTPDEPAEVHNSNSDLLDNYIFPMATGAGSIHGAAELLDFNTLVNNDMSNTAIVPGYFSITDPTPCDPESYLGANNNSYVTDVGMCQQLNTEGECTCHTTVMELLVSIRSAGSIHDQRLSLDAQLARLKQCIVSSETSLGCGHGREDSEPINILAVAMLLSYVIDYFKMIASGSLLRRSSSPPPSSSSSPPSSSVAAINMATLGNAERGSRSRVTTPGSTSMGLANPMEPRLSWGVFELEEEDEMDLRLRLYLLSFRKLEKVLSRLTGYLRELHNIFTVLPDAPRHMAFVIACDYTRLWLERKAADVKRLFSIPGVDETSTISGRWRNRDRSL